MNSPGFRTRARVRLAAWPTSAHISDDDPEIAEALAETAARLLERWHPLSGRQDASDFHLETGRLCVLLSRHRFACIVVARAGITDLLDRHLRSSPVYLDVPPQFPDGWRAHHVVMDHLENAARQGS